MVLGWDEPLCPNSCTTVLSGEHVHVYTGKKLWVGSEVYGHKKLRSDELRADTEAAMLGGRGIGLAG
jgi:hypothetical protein